MNDLDQTRDDADKSAAELAEETKEAAESRASQLKEKAAQVARDAVEGGKQEARARVDGIKDTAAGEANRTAKAVRDAANRFPEGDLRGVAATQIADGLGMVADRIRDKDLGDIPGDLTAFARRNPALFFAGAAVLGFAVARIAKATAAASDQRTFEDQDDYFEHRYSDDGGQA